MIFLSLPAAGRLLLLLVLSSIFSLNVVLTEALVPRDVAPRATVCNGHAELCSKSYGNVTFIGAHNSYAINSTAFLTANQDQSVTQQLNDGIRLLQIQAHSGSTIELCHTLCGLEDGGSLANYLTEVNNWLKANPNEVLSLLIVNIDNLPVTSFGEIFASVGLASVSFVPASPSLPASQWPTLGSMIDSGQRLVVFIDNQADPAAVPYLVDEFSNIWETAYDVTTSFDCAVNRTRGDPTTQMFLINHFLDSSLIIGVNLPVPDVAHLNVTNGLTGENSVGDQVDVCIQQHGRAPNFILVDFYEFGGGSVFEEAAALNHVKYSPTSPIATPRPTGLTSVTNGDSSLSRTSLAFFRPPIIIAYLILGFLVML